LDESDQPEENEDNGLLRPIFLSKKDREVLNADNVKKSEINQEQDLDKLEQDLEEIKHKNIQDLVKLSLKQDKEAAEK
jgi:hypothetical protein